MSGSNTDKEAWFNAVHAGSMAEVESMLTEHASDRDPQGETALMIAARANNLELVKLIQDCGHTHRNNDGETAQMIAAKFDYVEIVETLAVVESTIKTGDGDTALHIAIKNRSFNSVKVLLEYLETERNAAGYNAIDYAASLGDGEMLDFILASSSVFKKKCLEHAAEVAKNCNHPVLSAYLHAVAAKKVKSGSFKSFSHSVIHIAKPDGPTSMSDRSSERDAHAASTSSAAADSGSDEHQKELEALRAKLAEQERQLAEKDRAIAEKDREHHILTGQLTRAKEQSKDQSISRPVRKIMGSDHGSASRSENPRAPLANVKANEAFERDCEGNTPLMLAVEEKDYERAKQLVEEQGGLKNVYGTTALMIAAARGSLDFVKLLLDKEAGLQANSGTTALMKAAHNGHYEVCKVLAPKEVKKTRRDGWTALMSAATNNHCDILDILADEIGTQTIDGTTALHKAVVHNHLDAVKRLAEGEHKLRLKNGSTAFYMVNKDKSPEMYAFLSQYK